MQGTIRIIAGKWRGRKLKVLDQTDLRPTPDRVRETLFNWLNPMIEGAYCLDLFAGSGALGFEALSRGAAFVVMVDQSPQVVQSLEASCKQFGAENVLVYQAKAPEQLRTSQQPFDIVFLDPPYQDNLLLPCCFYLEKAGLLADLAYIYLEADHPIEQNELPNHWQLIKSKQAGQVVFHLVKREKLT